MNTIDNVFLTLVRLGIGTSRNAKISDDVDWIALKALADVQGLTAVVLDGLNEVRGKKEDVKSKNLPSQQFILQWIGEVMSNYEQRYAQYEKAISSLAGFYNLHGYKMMLLKGYACSLDWPKPNHRPCGDIDIWQFGKYKKADALLSSVKGIEIDNSHHHHTVFYWNDFMVENHYDFLDTSTRKSSREQEANLKELGTNDTFYISLNGEKVYLPSPNLHAFFLIRHMVDHFTSVSITLRQLLDWAFFVEKHSNEISWDWLTGMLEKYQLKDFTYCLNAICVENLGFESGIFHGFLFRPLLKEKILNDILNPKFEATEPSCILSRLIYKYRRWQGNAWKQKLCYPESRFLSFFTILKSHLQKPSSI